MTMVIVSGGIDLSVGSAIALTSVVGALLIQRGWSPAAVVAAGVAAVAGDDRIAQAAQASAPRYLSSADGGPQAATLGRWGSG